MPQRSSINFQLLLAATICVDAVSMSLIYGGAQQRAEGLYFAVVCGQLSALCAWASFSRKAVARSLVAFAFAIAAALFAGVAQLIHRESPEQIAVAYAGLWLTHAALLLVLLWAIKRTPYGRRWGQVANTAEWQFSMKHLLAIMTTLAILIVVLRTSELIQLAWLGVILIIVNNIAVAFSSILIHGARWHLVARFAATAGVVALLGSSLYAIQKWPEIIAVNFIHAFVLFAWLEVGGIMRTRDGATSADGADSNQ